MNFSAASERWRELHKLHHSPGYLLLSRTPQIIKLQHVFVEISFEFMTSDIFKDKNKRPGGEVQLEKL